MRKIFIALLGILFFNCIAKAQFVTIPDAAFRAKLMLLYPSCFNASQQMDTTCSQVTNETYLDLHYTSGTAFTNISGIEYFDSLKYLNVSGHTLSSINPPPALRRLNCSNNTTLTTIGITNNLRYLNCGNCNFNSLPALLSIDTLICPTNHLASLSVNTSLKYLDCFNNQIEEITGLAAVTNMKFLNCSFNYMDSSLHVLPDSLLYLKCNVNSFASLPALPSSLKYLDCSGQTNPSFTSLPALPNSMDSLTCNETPQLGGLPALPASLKYLMCVHSGLASLPALPNSLVSLNCSSNLLTSLPVLPASLQYLLCSNQTLTSLPTLPSFLIQLVCSLNQLDSLPTLPTSLRYLYCDNNNIDSLPAIPSSVTIIDCHNCPLNKLPALPAYLVTLTINNCLFDSLPTLPSRINNLDISYNPLNSLLSLPDSLKSFTCTGSNLSSLPELPRRLQFISCRENNALHCIPRLPPTLQTIWMDTSMIKCLPNPGSYNVIQATNPYPVCNVTNNIYQCQGAAHISGNIFYDNNSNGMKDPGEPYAHNIPVVFSNGSTIYTDTSGHYELYTDTGINTLHPVILYYYTASPDSFNYHLHVYDTSVSGNFALKPNASVDSLFISVTSMNAAARPGFGYPYSITIQNIGTTTIPASIVLNYNNTLLTYDSSSNSSVVNNGTDLSLSQTLVPGQELGLITYFKVKLSAPLGSELRSKATVSGNLATTADSTFAIITGSFDPNDKEATPTLTNQQVTQGRYINYIIHFQNTGNDTAFNIVITDTLNSKLQANSLQMISSSHNCKATRSGNTISFEFLNIGLVDSIHNEQKSHGFVKFRIKPQSSVLIGDVIPNKAHIYFDYNSPVPTNSATTTITVVTGIPTEPGLIGSKVFPNPSSTILNIQVPGQFDYTLYDVSGKMIRKASKLINQTTINAALLAKGMYLLQIKTSKGKITHKILIE